VAAFVMAVGFAISWFVPEQPLRTTQGNAPTPANAEGSNEPVPAID
jgi:hypothetical protein